MRAVGNAGSEDRKKMYAYGGFALIVAVYLYFQFFRDSSTSTAPPPPVIVTAPSRTSGLLDNTESSAAAATTPTGGKVAKIVGTTSAALDPTLHMESMLRTESVAYQGSGRNIFSTESAPPPVKIQQAIAPARPFTPPPPPVYVNPGPPPPPPIDLKFAGYFEVPGSGQKRAILLHGEDEVLAFAGDIVLRRYRVISISARSVEVEDIPNNNKQTIPLAN